MGPGLGLIAQIMFGFRPSSDDSNQKLYRTFCAFLGHSFYAKKNLFAVAFILCSLLCQAPETNTTDLIFSGIFIAAFPRNSLR
jgi:hypothetical protein